MPFCMRRPRLSSTRRSVARTDEDDRFTFTDLAGVTAELTSARRLLAVARSGAASSAVALGDVHTCASGVSQSVASLQSGNQHAAVADLSKVSSLPGHARIGRQRRSRLPR